MSDNEPGKYPGEQDLESGAVGGIPENSGREWTGIYFWPVYRDTEAAKKHTRVAALILILFTLIMTYLSLLTSKGEWTGFGLSLTAIYLMCAVGIYFFYLPAAYFGMVVFILTNLFGFIYRLATVGIAHISWLVVLTTIIFAIYFARSLSGVRQYKAFLKQEAGPVAAE